MRRLLVTPSSPKQPERHSPAKGRRHVAKDGPCVFLDVGPRTAVFVCIASGSMPEWSLQRRQAGLTNHSEPPGVPSGLTRRRMWVKPRHRSASSGRSRSTIGVLHDLINYTLMNGRDDQDLELGRRIESPLPTRPDA